MDWRHTHTFTQKAKKAQATLTGKGGRQVRGPNERATWVIGQVHETEGVLPAPSWRDGGLAAMSA